MDNVQNNKRVLLVNVNVSPFHRGFESSFLPYEYEAPFVPQHYNIMQYFFLRRGAPVKADSKSTQIVTRQ
jgi:hypothetical protein